MERVSETLVSRKEIEAAVTRLAKEISEDYKGKDLIVVGILKGAAVFLADLIRKIDCPMIMDFMQVSSFKIKKDLDYDISGKDVLIVEDIIDSGVTMQCLKRELFSRNPNSIRVVAAFDKPSRRTVDFRADYIGIEVPDKFIVGYGLDYAGKYRNLPDVCVLEVDGGDK